MRSIWMHPWDLDGVDPSELADGLRGLGLDGCRLALKYHGGRFLLPRGARGRVRQVDPAGVYLDTDREEFRSLRLRPRAASVPTTIPAFLQASADAGLQVGAWTVFCHDDRLGEEHPECCVRNVFGDRYAHALCPSHPDVRAYAAALAAAVASVPGLSWLDAEALSFMGYTHDSLHDRAGIPLTPEVIWLLSLCTCPSCHLRIGPGLEEASARAITRLEEHFEDPYRPRGDLRSALAETFGEDLLAALLAGRQRVVASLVDEVREAAGALPLDLRWTPDPLFIGGKSALEWGSLDGRTDAVTVTFFGASPDRMEADLASLPPATERTVRVNGGVVFHHPDCASEEDLQERVDLLCAAGMDGLAFYACGMASSTHLRWLRATLARTEVPGPAAGSIRPFTSERS